MVFKMDTSGFDAFQKELEQLSENAKSLDGEHQVPFNELFEQEFMRKHTSFDNIQNFLEEIGIDDQESFDNFPEEKLDTFVKGNTSFDSWQEMFSEAVNAWTFKKIGF